jgi:hypothetical protein
LFDRSSRLSQNSLPAPTDRKEEGQKDPGPDGLQPPGLLLPSTNHIKQKEMTKNKRSGGRPRKEECDRKLVISFRADSVTRRRLDRLVARAGKSISEVLREAVRNGTIEKSAYTEYLRSRKKLTMSDVVGLLVINTHVMEAMPKEMVKHINNFYKASVNINDIARTARSRGYDDLTRAYESISHDIAQIQEDFRNFIYEHRYGKEVKS